MLIDTIQHANGPHLQPLADASSPFGSLLSREKEVKS